MGSSGSRKDRSFKRWSSQEARRISCFLVSPAQFVYPLLVIRFQCKWLSFLILRKCIFHDWIANFSHDKRCLEVLTCHNTGQYADHGQLGESTEVYTVMIIILKNVFWFENNEKTQERDLLWVVIKCIP